MGKMTKSILQTLKEKHNKTEKENKEMKTTKILNTIKDITLITLIAGLVAFYGGMKYQEHQTSLVKSEAAGIVKSVKVEVSKE
jgi:hypothetical protein